MTNTPATVPAALDPAAAFEQLRREVSLTRRALEGLTAVGEHIPDYTPTLAAMHATLEGMQQRLHKIEKSPAMGLIPEAMAVEFLNASEKARAEDRKIINRANSHLREAIGRIDTIVDRGQAVDGQRKRQICFGAGGLTLGILIWSVLPGAVARTLPASWHVPEWMAARTLGRPSTAGPNKPDETGVVELPSAASNKAVEDGHPPSGHVSLQKRAHRPHTK